MAFLSSFGNGSINASSNGIMSSINGSGGGGNGNNGLNDGSINNNNYSN